MRDANAGNDETFSMGPDAALSGGAITAESSKPSAPWYNPAQFAAGGQDLVDISLAAYTLRLGGTQELRRADPTPQTESFSSVQLQAVPTAAAYGRRIVAWDIVFGLFVPNVHVSNPRSATT